MSEAALPATYQAVETHDLAPHLAKGFRDVHFDAALAQLAKERPIFYSEADFQHSFAWQLRSSYPEIKIYLEVPCPHLEEKHTHVDIILEQEKSRVAFEVKYYTRRLSAPYLNFELKNHGAEDCGRYDFLWDLYRIERMVDAGFAAVGYVLLLTNESLYWREPKQPQRETIDKAMRIHQGASPSGTIFWGEKASPGSMHNRDKKICFKRKYLCQWNNFSCLGPSGSETFRYLLLEVNR